MLIRNPINPYPQNITVNPKDEKFKFIFTGDRLGSYMLIVYAYLPTGESHRYTSNIIDLDEYAYNNTEIVIEKTMYEMGLQEGQSYTWKVYLSPYKWGGNTPQFSEDPDTFSSLRYFFQTASRPVITASPEGSESSFLINNKEYPCTYASEDKIFRVFAGDLNNRHLDIEGYYQNGNIKYYYFELYDENENIIQQTDKIFSAKIDFHYSGLVSRKAYILKLFSVSQQDQVANVEFQIYSTYEIKKDINYPPILTCNENEANVKIQWLKDNTSSGKTSGEYSIEDGMVRIKSGSIVYDNISDYPIIMDKNNFALGIKTFINNETYKILDYINNDILYEIYVKDYKAYLRYGSLNLTNKTIVELVDLKSKVLFGVQEYETPEPDTGYMWYDGEEYMIEDSKYILVSAEEEQEYYILLQNNNGNINCEMKRIETGEG